MRGKTVGIDFGTSTTLIAERPREGVPRLLPIGHVTPWMPSLLGIDESGLLVAGEQVAQLDPSRVVRSIKSALTEGRTVLSTPVGDIDARDGVRTILRTAIARALAIEPALFDDADVFLGCPALWTGRERRILIDVAHECGLDVDIANVIDEPVAAGLHWVNSEWLSGRERPVGHSLIFDAGGGTLDVAYLNVGGTDTPSMTVLSAEGRAESGDVLDRSILGHLREPFSDRADDPTFTALLSQAARGLKEQLSSRDLARLPVGAPYPDVVELDRATLEQIFESQLNRASRLVSSSVRGGLLRIDQPLDPAEIRGFPWFELADQVRHVALVGGMSQIPAVAAELSRLFPSSVVAVVDRPQESVVRGLVYGDRLEELNLPRPPIDFVAEFPDGSSTVIYEAYSPLYSHSDLMLGISPLGRTCAIPVPRGPGPPAQSFTLKCVMPDRARTHLKMSFRNHTGHITGQAEGIELDGLGPTGATLKLYTNGEFVVKTSRRSYRARVTGWPRLRGWGHDYDHEIQLTIPPARSEFVMNGPPDHWRNKS